jgi:D-xylose transport system ATP-binding protein
MARTHSGVPLLELRDIAIPADGAGTADPVSVTLHPGEVVGLLGQDGAARSALLGCLTGTHPARHGDVLVQGRKVVLATPCDARNHDIHTIRPTPALADNLDAAANLFLGRELVSPLGHSNGDGMRTATRKVMARLDPGFQQFDLPVSALTAGQRQSLAIARAVHTGATVLILEAPTAGLTPSDLQRLVWQIGHLKRRGIGIFVIDDDIPAVMMLCDRALVLRHGKRVGTVTLADVTDDDLSGIIILGKSPAKAA